MAHCACSAIARTPPPCRRLRKMAARRAQGRLALEALWATEPQRRLRREAGRRMLLGHAGAARCARGRCGCWPTIIALAAPSPPNSRSWHARNRRCTSAANGRRAHGGCRRPRACRSCASLLQHDEDAGDIHCRCCCGGRSKPTATRTATAVLDMFHDSPLWRTRSSSRRQSCRVSCKRFAMAGTQKDLQHLRRAVPPRAGRRSTGMILLKGFEEAFKGRSVAGLPENCIAEIAKLGGGSVAFGVRQGKPRLSTKALRRRSPIAKAPLGRAARADRRSSARSKQSADCAAALLAHARWRRNRSGAPGGA